MNKILVTIFSAILLSGCATVFLPSKQTITIITENPASTVYLDNEEFGKGAVITSKVKKDHTKQIVVQTPGHKDNYTALIQTRRQVGYWICQVINLPFNIMFMYPYIIDSNMPKNLAYEKSIAIDEIMPYINRKPSEKFIGISSVKLDIKDKSKDITLNHYYIYRTQNFVPKLIEEEKSSELKLNKEKKKEEKKKLKTNTIIENNEIKYDDTKFSINLYETLKKTGYIDTVNNIFFDANNTLLLEARITKLKLFQIYPQFKSYLKPIYKMRVFINWYIQNTYGETLDSVITDQLSGDFINNEDENFYEKMVADAIDISYLNLHNDEKLKKHLPLISNFDIKEANLNIPKPHSIVTGKSDAIEASVIVKSKNGHGSGFAVTNDGYILTNYHVISDKIAGKFSSIKVITKDGQELEAEIVRYNKFRDVVLLKVNKNFSKAFYCSNQKSFSALQDVYTIGAPKSIELGQSYSVGILSNERTVNNTHLLQLGMSVNSGNSGGPLFDQEGKLHGIVVSKLIGKNTEGVGFAVPSYLVEDYLKIKFN